VLFVVCLCCLAFGAAVSYARAKADALGVDANVGVVERSERLVGGLVATGLDGLGVPYIQAITLWAIAIGSFITLIQRIWLVRGVLLKGEAVTA
jgi:tetrahydromethanopterin S-methyltransferase subunit F